MGGGWWFWGVCGVGAAWRCGTCMQTPSTHMGGRWLVVEGKGEGGWTIGRLCVCGAASLFWFLVVVVLVVLVVGVGEGGGGRWSHVTLNDDSFVR
jgi:hypothetical protein